MDNINGFDIPPYEEESLLSKTLKFAAKIGEAGLEKVYLAYHVTRDPETPTWAKAKLGGSLAYLVMPADLIPDLTPALGFSDDIAAIAYALFTVTAHIKSRHHDDAKNSVDGLLGRKAALD